MPSIGWAGPCGQLVLPLKLWQITKRVNFAAIQPTPENSSTLASGVFLAIPITLVKFSSGLVSSLVPLQPSPNGGNELSSISIKVKLMFVFSFSKQGISYHFKPHVPQLPHHTNVWHSAIGEVRIAQMGHHSRIPCLPQKHPSVGAISLYLNHFSNNSHYTYWSINFV